MKRTPLQPLLRRLGACGGPGQAIEWAEGRAVGKAAWNACERGDWLLWIAARLGVDRRLVVLAACDCAAPALRFYETRYPHDSRPREAIRVARAWARGKATLEQVRAAAYAAYAAYAAAFAAYDAAAYAAADAAFAAADAAARTRSLARSARAVRRRIPWRVVRVALRRQGGE